MTSAKLVAFFLFGPWIITFFLRDFGPLRYQPLDSTVYMIVWAYLFFYIFGFFLAKPLLKKNGTNNITTNQDSDKLNLNYCNVLLVLTFIYICASIVDFVFYKSILQVGVTAARFHAESSEIRSSFLGAVHTILFSSPVLLACATMHRSSLTIDRKFSYTSWSLVFLSIFVFMLSGGRNAFFIAISYIAIYKVLLYRIKIKKLTHAHSTTKQNPKKLFIFTSGLVAIVGIVYSLYLFIDRIKYTNSTFESTISKIESNLNLVYAWDLPNSYFFEIFLLPLIMVDLYITHGLSFLEVLLKVDTPLSFGAYSFSFFTMIYDKIIGDIGATQVNNIATGSYVTMLGSIYIDFGIAGVFVFSVILGILTAFLDFSYRKKMGFLNLAAFTYILVLLLFSPLYIITNIASGPSYLILLTILASVKGKK